MAASVREAFVIAMNDRDLETIVSLTSVHYGLIHTPPQTHESLAQIAARSGIMNLVVLIVQINPERLNDVGTEHKAHSLIVAGVYSNFLVFEYILENCKQPILGPVQSAFEHEYAFGIYTAPPRLAEEFVKHGVPVQFLFEKFLSLGLYTCSEYCAVLRFLYEKGARVRPFLDKLPASTKPHICSRINRTIQTMVFCE